MPYAENNHLFDLGRDTFPILTHWAGHDVNHLAQYV